METGGTVLALPSGDGPSSWEAEGGPAAGWAQAPALGPRLPGVYGLATAHGLCFSDCALETLKGTCLYVETGLIPLTSGCTKVCCKLR